MNTAQTKAIVIKSKSFATLALQLEVSRIANSAKPKSK